MLWPLSCLYQAHLGAQKADALCIPKPVGLKCPWLEPKDLHFAKLLMSFFWKLDFWNHYQAECYLLSSFRDHHPKVHLFTEVQKELTPALQSLHGTKHNPNIGQYQWATETTVCYLDTEFTHSIRPGGSQFSSCPPAHPATNGNTELVLLPYTKTVPAGTWKGWRRSMESTESWTATCMVFFFNPLVKIQFTWFQKYIKNHSWVQTCRWKKQNSSEEKPHLTRASPSRQSKITFALSKWGR